jgi:hypothetical protein
MIVIVGVTGKVNVIFDPLRVLFSASSLTSRFFNRAFSSAILLVASSKAETFASKSFTCRSFLSRKAR